jgi:hypothetical protein
MVPFTPSMLLLTSKSRIQHAGERTIPPPLTPPRVALKARLRHDGEGDMLASAAGVVQQV